MITVFSHVNGTSLLIFFLAVKDSCILCCHRTPCSFLLFYSVRFKDKSVHDLFEHWT
ncbi:hypothetical protein POPTR_011G077440v4 [Populus trichocarpa]|uniref:Uncharacterized protein n=1 Tax=Populus trichocarpa TaxID=3694 RepID=A0ACC0S9W6_POPTR|nr:hypothetical protein POPTR_011G077440v4 [Populus trichocarpa]